MNVSKKKFKDFDALQILTTKTAAIVLVGAGPRIISLRRPGGGELMFQDPALFGDSPDPTKAIRRGMWKIMGGNRVWVYRDSTSDECEESYAKDNDACTVLEDADSVTITGAVHPVFRIQRGFKIRENPHGGLDVTHFVRNASDQMLWSGGVWAIAVVDPSCEIGVLTGDPGSNWQATPYQIVWNWAGHRTSQKYVDEQLKIRDGLVLTLPGDEEGKVMVQSPLGAIIAQTQGTAFFKLVSWQGDRATDYPAGCNTAIYSAPGRVFRESETMGPCCSKVEAGQMVSHTERWVLGDAIPWGDIRTLRHVAQNFKEG